MNVILSFFVLLDFAFNQTSLSFWPSLPKSPPPFSAVPRTLVSIKGQTPWHLADVFWNFTQKSQPLFFLFSCLLSSSTEKKHTESWGPLGWRASLALWPPGSKVWDFNQQAARSVEAEPAISASYWHKCHTLCTGCSALKCVRSVGMHTEAAKRGQVLWCSPAGRT